MMDVEGPLGDIQELMRRIKTAMSGNIEETQVEYLPPRGITSGFQIRH